MHPEGALYFYHPPTVSFVARCILFEGQPVHVAQQRTYTTTNLYNEESFSAMEGFLRLVQVAKSQHIEELRGDTETGLSLVIDETGKQFECLYYLIDHGQRVSFWLNEYNSSEMLREAPGATELSHIREPKFKLPTPILG
jgi:hypothetical protein